MKKLKDIDLSNSLWDDFQTIPAITIIKHNTDTYTLNGVKFDREKYFNGDRILPIYIDRRFKGEIKYKLKVGNVTDLEVLLDAQFKKMKNTIKQLPWYKRLFNMY